MRHEHLKFASIAQGWLRRRLAASGCIDIAIYVCFAFLTSLVLTNALIRHLKR